MKNGDRYIIDVNQEVLKSCEIMYNGDTEYKPLTIRTYLINNVNDLNLN